MRKIIIPVIVCTFLYFVVNLIYPHLATSRYYVDSTLCITCHNHDDLSASTIHSNCDTCHSGSYANIPSNTCSACHPSDDPDGCNIVDIHGSTGSNCLDCHANHCGEDTTHMDICLECHVVEYLHLIHNNCTPCHTPADQGGIVEFSVEPDKCILCHTLGSPDKCNLANYHGASCQGCHTECDGGGATTTVPSSGHTAKCLECHDVGNPAVEGDTIHGHHTGESCDRCHIDNNVSASACIECHPDGDPGKCNLANYHAPGACLECHTQCATNTTTIAAITTTTISPTTHIDICLACHDASYPNSDLHINHSDCNSCHDGGAGQTGNVKPGSCVVSDCHPIGNPGKCNLADFHGASTCLSCHAECRETTSSTTTSTNSTTTTTISSAYHIDTCMKCHGTTDLHADAGHSGDCSRCHDGEGQAGNVEVGKCIVCHPMGNPGRCNLANHHGGSCLDCHSECEETTTTTTANITPAVIDITIFPKSAFRSHFMPLPLVMLITGTDSNFNCKTRVSFEGNTLTPPFSITLSPKRIIAFTIIIPAGFETVEDSEVTVNVSSTVAPDCEESYEEVGSWYLTLKTLPWILDEEKGKL